MEPRQNDFIRSRPISILSVEDSYADQRLILEMFKESSIQFNVTFTPDGEEALRRLLRQEPFANEPRPDIILLDINLPKRDGFEVLAEIRGTKAISEIPVVVLTTAQNEEVIAKCREYGANCYLGKPSDLAKFSGVVKAIEQLCESLLKERPVESSFVTLRNELELERAHRRIEREDLRTRIHELEKRLSDRDEELKRLHDHQSNELATD